MPSRSGAAMSWRTVTVNVLGWIVLFAYLPAILVFMLTGTLAFGLFGLVFGEEPYLESRIGNRIRNAALVAVTAAPFVAAALTALAWTYFVVFVYPGRL